MKKPFIDLNPYHCVPTIVHGDFVLWESHAVLKYLCDAFKGNNFLSKVYPEDAIQRARINQLLGEKEI